MIKARDPLELSTLETQKNQWERTWERTNPVSLRKITK